MITEDYVSFEVAKLLKENGFDVSCRVFYKDSQAGLYEFKNAPKAYKDKLFEPCFLAPSLYMAMKWLREVYGIFIAINNNDLDFNWQCYDLINRGSTLDPKILSESYAGYKTYEEAVEAALKYSLENLI